MAEDRIIDKIRALFKHAESAQKLGSVHEAEAFVAKAQELLLQYNIDMAALMERAEADSVTVVDPVTDQRFNVADMQGGNRWQGELLGVLALAHGCKTFVESRKAYKMTEEQRKAEKEYVDGLSASMRAYYKRMRAADAKARTKSKRYDHVYGVYGRSQTLEILKLMFEYLTTNLTAMSRAAYTNASERTKRDVTRFSFLQSYLLGAVEALKIRVQKTQQANMLGTNALIVYNAAAVQAYGADVLNIQPSTTERKAVKLANEAFRQGFREGTAMSLEHQTYIR